MKIELFYVVRKYTHGAHTELNKPMYVAGPFSDILKAYDEMPKVYDREGAYVIASQIIEVKEI